MKCRISNFSLRNKPGFLPGLCVYSILTQLRPWKIIWVEIKISHFKIPCWNWSISCTIIPHYKYLFICFLVDEGIDKHFEGSSREHWKSLSHPMSQSKPFVYPSCKHFLMPLQQTTLENIMRGKTSNFSVCHNDFYLI